VDKKLILVGALVALLPTVLAEPTLESLAASIDMTWMLLAAFLVFFMQAGFAMVESGFTRAKNTGNIMMKNLMDFAIGSLGYFAIGFGIMFGAGTAFFGIENFLLAGATMQEYAFWMFQVVFAATAATIVSGAMAERTRFSAYLAFSFAITAIIYPVVGHWAWGGGWLSELEAPFIDFAGSTVVHSVGGWAALAGAIAVGPRIGKYIKGKAVEIKGHSLPLATLGVFILWFGWYGFNAGSTLAGTNASIAAIAVTTTLAAAAGATAAMAVTWLKSSKPNIGMTLNGALAGLVSITAGTANVSPLSAIIIGAIGGTIVVAAVKFFDSIKVDDPVGAISVHGVCGAWGTLAVGLFAEEAFGGVNGLLFGGGISQLASQATGIAAAFLFVFPASLIMFKAINVVIGLRASEEDEIKGLDASEHKAEAYHELTGSSPM